MTKYDKELQSNTEEFEEARKPLDGPDEREEQRRQDQRAKEEEKKKQDE